MGLNLGVRLNLSLAAALAVLGAVGFFGIEGWIRSNRHKIARLRRRLDELQRRVEESENAGLSATAVLAESREAVEASYRTALRLKYWVGWLMGDRHMRIAV